MSMTAPHLQRSPKRKIPRPPGASVELPHVSAEEPELVRHRGEVVADLNHARGAFTNPLFRASQ